jgi:general secretion pathway protein A
MSRGVPRLINVICDKSLVLGYGGDKARIGRRIVRQVTQDWSVFGDPRHVASAGHSRRRRAARRTRLGLRAGRIAAVGLVALLATGFLVARPRTLDRETVVGPPAAVGLVTPPGAGESGDAASLEPAAPEAEVTDTLRRESAVTPADRTGVLRGRPGGEGAGIPSVPRSAEVLTVPAAAQSSERPVAVVTMQTGDTLPWLLHSVYGRVNHTVVDVVQLANPSVDGDRLRSGQRLRFPPIEPSAMVHKLAERRYVVHVLTTPDPADRRVRKLSADIVASGRMVRLVPVRLWTGCGTCFRMWAGEFRSLDEAEGFYRRMRPGDAA